VKVGKVNDAKALKGLSQACKPNARVSHFHVEPLVQKTVGRGHKRQPAYRDGSLLKLGNAAWNTFAQVRNTASAVENMGGALSSADDPFKFASDADDDGKDVGLAILASLISLALLGGSLITAAIIRFYSGTVPLPDRDISYWLVRDNRVRGWDNPI